MQPWILSVIVVSALVALLEAGLILAKGMYCGFNSRAFQEASKESKYAGNIGLLVYQALKPVPVTGWRRWVLGAAFFALLLLVGVVASTTGYVAYAEALVRPCIGSDAACARATPKPTTTTIRDTTTPTPTTIVKPGPVPTVTATSRTTPSPVVIVTPTPTPTATIQPTATLQPTVTPVNDTITVNVNQNLSCSSCPPTGLAVWVDHVTSTGGVVYVYGTVTNTGTVSYTNVTCNGTQGTPQLYLPGSSTGLPGFCGSGNDFTQLANDGHPVAFTVTISSASLAHQQTYRFYFCLQMNNGATPPPFTMDFDDLVFSTT